MGGVGGGGYFDNAQDEATGGEGHTNNNIFEEEKMGHQYHNQDHADANIDQQSSSLLQENASTNNQNDTDGPHQAHQQNNNQSADVDSAMHHENMATMAADGAIQSSNRQAN